MTNKEIYLSQAYRIDQRTNSKIEQLRSPRALSKQTTSTITIYPCSDNRNKKKWGCFIVKIIYLKREIDDKIDRTIDLKQKIALMTKRFKNPEYQIL